MTIKNAKSILVCPLDWGLGHAARCIPIMKLLGEKGHRVLAAASGATYSMIRHEIPNVELLDFPGYNITYPPNGNMAGHMLRKSPQILKIISREHELLDRLIPEHGIDLVISDNRFGMWNKAAYCIFITHQIMIKCPPALKLLEPVLYKINRRYINRFDECWIPDLPGKNNISGDLSHRFPLPANARYIGWLSRFSGMTGASKSPNPESMYDLLGIISGPEPQRTIFENILIHSLKASNLRACIVRGTPGRNSIVPGDSTIDFFDHLPAEQLRELINNCRHLICRPGYSTLMDLMALKKNAILVPTPGQTEQEYLAQHLHRQGLFFYCRQDQFNLDRAIQKCSAYNGFSNTTDGFFFSVPESL